MKAFEIFKKATNATFTATGRTLLWLLALFMVLVVIAELALIGTVAWLHAEGGQNWLRGQLAAATEESGYDVDFSGLSYRFPQGIGVKSLSVFDEQGELAAARNVVVRPAFLPLAAKHLSFGVYLDELVLSRLPEGGEGQVEEGVTGFDLPDLYFNVIELDRLEIERLEVAEDIAGVRLVLSPRVSARLRLEDAVVINLEGEIGQPEGERLVWLPQNVAFDGVLEPQSMKLRIEKLSLAAPVYALEGRGLIDLADNALDLAVSGQARELAQISADLAGSAALSGQVTGALDNPVLDVEAKPRLEFLKERGLSNMTVTATARDLSGTPNGQVEVQVNYQKRQGRFAAGYVWQAPVLSLSDITGSAPLLALSGEVELDTETTLAQGSLQLSAEDFEPYSDLIGIVIGGSGTVAARLSVMDGRQAAAVETHLANVVYDDFSAAKIDLTASVPNIQSPFPEDGQLDVRGLYISDAGRFDKLSAKTVRKKDGASYHLTFAGDGHAQRDFTLRGNADVDGVASGLPSFSNIALTVASAGSEALLSGAVSQQNVDLSISAKEFALSALPVSLPAQFQMVTLDAQAQLEGAPSAPSGTYKLRFSPLEVSGLDFNIGIDGGYQKGMLSAELNGTGKRIRQLVGSAKLPFNLSLMPFTAAAPQGAMLDGGLTFDADAHVLAAALLPPGHNLTGQLKVLATLAGPPDSPDIKGTLRFSDGSYAYDAYDLKLYDLNFEAALEPKQLRVTKLSANDGEKGQLTGAGVLSLVQPQDTALSLKATEFHLLGSERADGYVGADLSFSGREGGYLMGGSVVVGPLDIQIPERFLTDIPQLNVVSKDSVAKKDEALQKVALDVSVKADNRIFVRGWGLDAEFGGKVAVSGTLGRPELNGTLKSVRGRYEEFGRRFEIAKANLRFQGTVPPSPYLDIKATSELDEVAAGVTLTGPMENVSLGFSSVPALPEDEVLARILFGRDMQNITPFQALQLKQTLDRFRGKGGGFDPLAQIRNLTGIDDIRIEEGSDGGATVGVGTYLSDKVYLELEKGATEGSGGASVEIELTPHISAESKIGEDAQAGAGISWRWDY